MTGEGRSVLNGALIASVLKKLGGTVVGCLRERRSVLRRIVGKCCLVFNGGCLQDFIAFVSCYDDFFREERKGELWVRAYSGFVWLGSYKPYRLS